MITSSSEPVLIQGPLSKKGKSVAGIGLWWKTRYFHLTASYLTVTDLKQKTLLASISTADLLLCAPVKTRRARGRRFMIRLVDNTVLQLCALSVAECIQWVSVLVGVCAVVDKQRSRDWQGRKEASHSIPPTPVLPQRAQTSGDLQYHITQAATQGINNGSTAGGGHITADATINNLDRQATMYRANSTGSLAEHSELERKLSRDRKAAQQQQQQQQLTTPSSAAGLPIPLPLPLHTSQFYPLSSPSANASASSGVRDRDRDSHAHTHSHAADKRFAHRSYDEEWYDEWDEESEEETDNIDNDNTTQREGEGYTEYNSILASPLTSYYPPQPLLPPPPPMPTQQLYLFLLVFCLLSFTILGSGHTYATHQQVSAIYDRYLIAADSPIPHYHQHWLVLLLECWPAVLLIGSVVQFVHMGKDMVKNSHAAVDWFGGILASAAASIAVSYCSKQGYFADW